MNNNYADLIDFLSKRGQNICDRCQKIQKEEDFKFSNYDYPEDKCKNSIYDVLCVPCFVVEVQI